MLLLLIPLLPILIPAALLTLIVVVPILLFMGLMLAPALVLMSMLDGTSSTFKGGSKA